MSNFYPWVNDANAAISGEQSVIQDYTEFSTDSQRDGGFVANTAASSKRVNTALRLSTLVSSALMEVVLPSGSNIGYKSSLVDVKNGIKNYLKNASNITSGTLNADRLPTIPVAKIPDLSADKITSGTLNEARIPALSAGKITSGILNINRIPGIPVSKLSDPQNLYSIYVLFDGNGQEGNLTSEMPPGHSYVAVFIKILVPYNDTHYYQTCLYTPKLNNSSEGYFYYITRNPQGQPLFYNINFHVNQNLHFTLTGTVWNLITHTSDNLTSNTLPYISEVFYVQ